MDKHDVYRDEKVHVMADKCSTCIFRPGNLMSLEQGRVAGMVQSCREKQGVITCHQTLYEQDERGNAVCKGFFDAYGKEILPLRMAMALEVIEYQEPKEK